MKYSIYLTTTDGLSASWLDATPEDDHSLKALDCIDVSCVHITTASWYVCHQFDSMSHRLLLAIYLVAVTKP
jgi:hypothetical protein